MMGRCLAICVVLTLAITNAHGQQTTSGSSCAPVLDAGVYNIYSSSSSGGSFSQVQNAMCTSYAEYTYRTYQSQHAQLDAAILSGSVSQAVADAYCNSQARKFDVAAKASWLGFGGSGSYGNSDSSSNCGSGSASSSASSYSSAFDASSFALATTNIKSYQQSSCGSTNQLSSNSASVQQLQKILDPQVYAAYTSCLNLYAAGIHFKQTSSYDNSILAIDLIYHQPVNGKPTASLYGFDTTGSVSCTLRGPKIPAGAATTLVANLSAGTSYTITCKLGAKAVKNGNWSDVFIYTSPGGTFHGLIFNGVTHNALTQISDLQSKFAGLQKAVRQANAYVTFKLVPSKEFYSAPMRDVWTTVWSNALTAVDNTAGKLIISLSGRWIPDFSPASSGPFEVYFGLMIDGNMNWPGVFYDQETSYGSWSFGAAWRGFTVMEHVHLTAGVHTVGLAVLAEKPLAGALYAFRSFSLKGTFFPTI